MYRLPRALLIAGFIALFASIPAMADDGPVSLKTGKPIMPDVAAYPRVVNGGAVGDKINTALARDERNTLKSRDECKDFAKDNSAGFDYSVTIETTMKGPGFISFVKDTSDDCGGPHPNGDTLALAFDLKDGTMLNWYKLLPAGLLKQTSEDKQSDRTEPGTIRAQGIQKLYMQNYKEGEEECEDVFADPQAFIFWPDAKNNGIAFYPPDIIHAAAPCQLPVTIPVEKLRALGADKTLLDAIQAAHDHGWYDKS